MSFSKNVSLKSCRGKREDEHSYPSSVRTDSGQRLRRDG